MKKNPKILAALLIVIVAGASLQGCSTAPTTAESEEEASSLAPGIFLEAEERAVLPPGVELRRIDDRHLNVTKVSEGFRSKLYNDVANYCTIAYGHLIKLAPCNGTEPIEFRGGISEPQGTKLLHKDMEKAQIAVMLMTRNGLSDGQFAALCDFAFNVGPGNLRKSSLLKAIRRNQMNRVPAEFRRWTMAGGKQIPGLKRRREKEIALFFEGMGIPRLLPSEEQELPPVDIRVGENGN